MAESKKLKYNGYSIVCEEVPDEVSLAINISGCPHKCEGCHSEYLQEYNGEYLAHDLQSLLNQYDGLITCVCFMGGDSNLSELRFLCGKVKEQGLKVCIYSGYDSLHIFIDFIMFNYIDYLKIGSYKQELGGLNNPKTNQRMYKVSCGRLIDDITYRFQERF